MGLVVLATASSCEIIEDYSSDGAEQNVNAISTLSFVDEYILPDGLMYDNTIVGGLSGLDYVNGSWYMISDDATAPIRFYKADLKYDETGFDGVAIKEVVELMNEENAPFEEGTVDPEALRITRSGDVIWTSEGNVNNGVNPSVRFASADGSYISKADINAKFEIADEKGPRHNGAFEGITLDNTRNGYWVAMELPLKQDGEAPSIEDTDAPARIIYIDKNGTFGKEFVYELDPIARRAEETSFTINGIVEILAYDMNKFLVLERSFSTGFSDGGNDVKIYDVDASNATDVSEILSLENATYQKATKTLLFDFESVRNKLTGAIVDNVEGIAFGPKLENGNRSLVLVADNNFSAFGPQLNQLILLEVE